MDNVLSLIRERHQRAISKIERAEKALEVARNELSDVEAALRVVADITGATQTGTATQGKPTNTETVSERQVNILLLLRDGKDKGLEPKEIYNMYCAVTGDDISIDTFRTTIWRMQKAEEFESGGQRWSVKSENGRYWKEPLSSLFS